ncbi:LysR substrate-binding domain-containing protein [Shewanella gelidii]|uniref:LysR family transcriptional regulator n=1 Tax=Shewanella gelidii TaxID=1642821 RepID=A0A917JJ51_9GAMM|nr:LysR substrate-binding domain-containing protein [Shewanella gelidii]MCL1096908.1 LysR substrate-binding domain-containing protein [Shewanella gelidii]GGI71101.1 LysR family transcriptional regulator [Shewanella gelidii]
MIELRHLRTLVALKESGSLAAAAKIRFVTQSALSHQIKELETRINSAIFIRKSKPLSFTEEGTRLLNLAEEILPRVLETESDLKQGRILAENSLKVGLDCHSCLRWLMPVVDKFKQAHLDSDLNVSSYQLADALNAIESGKLDIVLTSDPIPGQALAYQHLFDFEMKLIVANDHPLAKQDYVLPHQLEGETLLSYPIPLANQAFYRHFVEPAGVTLGHHKTYEHSNILLQRVACNEGVVALPTWAITDAYSHSVKSLKIGLEGLKRPLFGAYKRDITNGRLVQDWFELVTKAGLARQHLS